MDRLQKNIIRNVKALRKAQSMTQENLAGEVGLSVYTISQMERGASIPSIVTLEGISVALNCSVNDLISDQPISVCDKEEESQVLASEIWAELAGQRPTVLKACLKAIKAIKEIN